MKPTKSFFNFVLPLGICFGISYSLTDGPKQPEYESFLPVGDKDMVNLSTGDFSYSIDLLEIPTADGTGYPIKAFYVAGIGVNQEASWIGLGWNLNAGSISRQVVNHADDLLWQEYLKRGPTVLNDIHTTSLSTPLGTETYTHSTQGGGQLAYTPKFYFGGVNYSNTNINTSTKQIKSFSLGVESVNLTSGPRNRPDFGTTRTWEKPGWYANFWASIPFLKLDYGHQATLTNSNFDFYNVGFLYNEYEYNGQPNRLYDYKSTDFSEKTSLSLYDAMDINARITTDDLPYLPFSTADNFVAMAEGLNGQFKAFPKNKKLQSVSANGFGSNKYLDLSHDNVAGNYPSDDYYISNRKRGRDELEFWFLDDVAGSRGNPNYYTHPNGRDVRSNQPKKIIPKYGPNRSTKATHWPVGTILPNSGMLTGFRIIEEQGITYDFDIPVYLYGEYSETSANSLKTHNGDRWTSFFMPSTIGNPATATTALAALNGNPLYATEFLLTTIKGPDYVDANSNGSVDIGDVGYWVKFDYEKTTIDANGGYIYRVPFSGLGASSIYDGNSDEPAPYTMTYGRKDLYYLRNITTSQAIAVFDIFKRHDGHESGNLETGGVRGVDSYFGLKSISLFPLSAFSGSKGSNGVWDLSEAIGSPQKVVQFSTSYLLTPGTPNSTARNGGKLTLERITIKGKGGVQLPPYQFYYDHNPSYRQEGFDRWGFYKSDGASNFAEGYSNHVAINPGEIKAWSLSRLKLPSGAEIAIDYESDEYNKIQNSVIGKTIPNLNEYYFVPGETPGKSYFEDDVTSEMLPNGPGSYEIRSFAPGWVPGGSFGRSDNPYETYALEHKNISNIGNSGNTNLVRRMIIYRNEIPKGFNFRYIYALAHSEETSTACLPEQNLEVEFRVFGFKNGTKIEIRKSGWTDNFSPQWASSGNLEVVDPGQYDYLTVEFWGRDDHEGPCQIGIKSRDMRVWLREAEGNISPVAKRSKYGGGLRVRELVYKDNFDPTKEIRKSYYYDSNGDGTGFPTGVATKEPAIYGSENNDDRIVPQYSIAGLIPYEKVYYSKVTVKEADNTRNQYEFHTPDDFALYGEFAEHVINGNNWQNNSYIGYSFPGGHVFINQLRHSNNLTAIQNWSQFWGLLRKQQSLDASGKQVAGEERRYGNDLSWNWDEVRSESYYLNVNVPVEFSSTRSHTVRQYYFTPTLQKLLATKDGVTNVTDYKYNPLNGMIASETSKASVRFEPDPENPGGEMLEFPMHVRVKELEYAHGRSSAGAPYNIMGHKDETCPECKNMLSQVSEEYVKWENSNYVSATVFPWKDYGSGQIYQEGVFKWRHDNEGTAAKPQFTWSNIPWNANDPAWVKQYRILKHDKFEHPIEVEDATGVVHSSVFGHGNSLQTGYLPALRFQEASVFTGDYDTGEDPNYFDLSNGWSKGLLAGGVSEVVPRGHFGKASVHVKNAYGPVKDVWFSGDQKKKYTLSAWVQHVSGNCVLYIDQRKVINGTPTVIPGSQSFARTITSGDKKWSFQKVDVTSEGAIHAEAEILRGLVGCPNGGEAYVDEIRFSPSNAIVQTVFYDPDIRKPITMVDENGTATRYEYDGLGRLTGKRNASGALVSEQSIDQKSRKVNFVVHAQIEWDGTPNLCYGDLVMEESGGPTTQYAILSSTNTSQLVIDPSDNKKLCPVSVDQSGNGSSQITVQFLETGEVVTAIAEVHGPHFIPVNLQLEAECQEAESEPNDCLFFWNSLRVAANLDQNYTVISYKLKAEFDVSSGNFYLYHWRDFTFPVLGTGSYDANRGAHLYFGYHHNYLTENNAVVPISNSEFVRGAGPFSLDNIGFLLPRNSVWGVGNAPNYTGPWSFSQEFTWPRKYFENPPHVHNQDLVSSKKVPYTTFIGVYGFGSNAAWAPFNLYPNGAVLKIVGATVVDKF